MPGRSDIEDDRQDHGIALDLLVDVAVQFVLDAVFEGRPVFAAQVAGSKDLPYHVAGVFDDILVFPHIDEAAADDVRAGNQLALVPVDGHDHND